MSQRLGMADGRCFTINSSSQLYDNYIMKENAISFADNYSFRKLLQEKGPALLKPSQACLLYTSPSPRDLSTSRMPSSA